MTLRTLDYLTNIQEYDGVAISADLQCSCGCNSFSFQYKGKQTKGILAPYIIKSNKQLAIKATCEHCQNSFVLYDSSKDGSTPKACADETNFVPFVLPKSNEKFYKAIIKYNYRPEKIKCENQYSNQFENCFVYLLRQNGKEEALIEE